MKLLHSILLACSVFSVSSCVTTKTYTVEEKNMRIESDKVFVVKSNGEKVVGHKFSWPGSMNLNANWVKIDGVKYEMTDLTALQDKKAYYVLFGDTWVKQLKRGKINLFDYEVVTHNGVNMTSMPTHNEYDMHFVFQKGNGKLVELSIEGISAMLADNPRAANEFDAQFKPGRTFLPKQLQNHPKVLFDVIDTYNGDK